MPVLGLNHINIRTPDFQRTVNFLRDALGMTVQPVAASVSTDKAVWICDESGAAILHLASADVPYSPTEVLPAVPPRGSGAINHIALSCTDYEGMRQRLDSLNITFRESPAGKVGVRQIFVLDPTNIQYELNFS